MFTKIEVMSLLNFLIIKTGTESIKTERTKARYATKNSSFPETKTEYKTVIKVTAKVSNPAEIILNSNDLKPEILKLKINVARKKATQR